MYVNFYINDAYRDVGMAVHGTAHHPPMLAPVPTLGISADLVPAASDPVRGICSIRPASAEPPAGRTGYLSTLVNDARKS